MRSDGEMAFFEDVGAHQDRAEKHQEDRYVPGPDRRRPDLDDVPARLREPPDDQEEADDR